jgi:hypothetical protein
VFFQQRFGQTVGFLAEHQKIAVFIRDVGISLRALGREEIEIVRRGVFFVEFVERIVISHVEVLPVIQPRAFERAVGNFKT